MNFCFEFLQELSIVWEAISNTRKSVSSYFQTPRSWFKKIRLRLVFPTYFSVFGNWRKHSSSCLIYYFIFLSYNSSKSQNANYIILMPYFVSSFAVLNLLSLFLPDYLYSGNLLNTGTHLLRTVVFVPTEKLCRVGRSGTVKKDFTAFLFIYN